MINNYSLNLPRWLAPATESCVGLSMQAFSDKISRPLSITTIAWRILAALTVTLSSIADLVIWAAMTITVYSALVNDLAHIVNLIATLAIPILSIGILFGYSIPSDFFRYTWSAFRCYSYNYELRGDDPEAERAARKLLKSHCPQEILNSELRTTAMYRRENVARILLEGRADPNAKNHLGETAVSLAAAEKNNSEVLKLLIAHQGNPSDGLEEAVSDLCLSNVKVLLKHGGETSSGLPLAVLGIRNWRHRRPATRIGVESDEDRIYRLEHNSHPRFRSLALTKAIIRQLINARMPCRPDHLTELNAFVNAVEEENGYGYEEAIFKWINEEQQNPFRVVLKNWIAEIYLPDPFQHPTTQNRVRENRKIMVENIKLMVPFVIKARGEFTEKCCKAIAEANHCLPIDLARLIAQYVY